MLISMDLTPDEATYTVDEALRRDYFDNLRKTLDAVSLAELGNLYAKQFGRPADLSIGAANLKELILTDLRLNSMPTESSVKPTVERRPTATTCRRSAAEDN
jgi:hypothetical protein